MRAFLSTVVCTCPFVLGASIAACSSGSPTRVSLAPSLVFPEGVLDTVQTLTVTVFDGSGAAACDATTGKPTGVTAKTTVIAAPPPFSEDNCASGVKFCGSITLDQSATPRIFAAVGKDANGTEVADGCTKQVIQQAQVAFTITMVRNAPATVCAAGNTVIGPTEQCAAPGQSGDAVCDMMCDSVEEYLSTPGSAGSTVAGGVGDKVLPQFFWPAASGDSGRFVALWEDHAGGAADAGMGSHVAMRLMTDSLYPLAASDFNAEAAASSFFLPNDNTTMPPPFPPKPDMGEQGAPSIAVSGGSYWVAFQDNDTQAGNDFDIHMRSMSAATFTAQQPADMPLGINGVSGGGETGEQFSPSIAAGPGGNLFIAWQDAATVGAQGEIRGAGFSVADVSLFDGQNAQTLSDGSATNDGPVVAATPNEWIVAWQAGTSIVMRGVDSTGGLTEGPQSTVNNTLHQGLQDHPAIAGIGDGRFAIVWVDHGASGGAAIIVQRFNGAGQPVDGDQQLTVNTTTDGDQLKPSIAASSASGGFYVVSWLDSATGDVRARLLGGNGSFLFNNVDGTDNDFQVSIAASHTRDNPTAAVGGTGQSIAIGWEDLTAGQPGIYARRFPVPQQ